ncbi:Uncharacterised protein [Vibrio cholerae]|nr:Uncharacterised protein [Vibrio cholerae]
MVVCCAYARSFLNNRSRTFLNERSRYFVIDSV